MTFPSLLCVLLLLCTGAVALTKPALLPLQLGSVTPEGWYKAQLLLQADGLPGHLSLFYPDIADSMWIGGTADTAGAFHERTPYWLNGMVPLASQLLSITAAELKKLVEAVAAGTETPCSKGFEVVSTTAALSTIPRDAPQLSHEQCLQACVRDTQCSAFSVSDKTGCALYRSLAEGWPVLQASEPRTCSRVLTSRTGASASVPQIVKTYVDTILSLQNKTSGWLGPNDMADLGVQYWGPMNVLQALAMFAEYNTNYTGVVTESMTSHILEAGRRMATIPMSDWASARYQDQALSILWLLERTTNVTIAQSLLEVAELGYKQGLDWEDWFTSMNLNSGVSGYYIHGVNNAQAIKSAGVQYVYTGNETLRTLASERIATIDQLFGLPTGMFCADELLCAPPSKLPSRGSELCAVVESMFSYATLFSVFGDVAFCDRVESIAFNALPATWASPTGGDMWAHQYLQAVNEIAAEIQSDHIWPNDGPEAEIYGLEPNDGCCTANGPQGWPKLGRFVFFSTDDGGVAVGAFVPSTATYPDGSALQLTTTYPFDDVITITAVCSSARPLRIRIPGWATGASVTVNGVLAAGVVNGTMFLTTAVKGTTKVIVSLNAVVRVESWSNNSISVYRGPLLFSLPLACNFSVLNTYPFESKDYSISSAANWSFALSVSNPVSAAFTVTSSPYVDGAAPFNRTGTQWVKLTGTGRPVFNWPLDMGSAGAVPASPACTNASNCGPEESITLVPHGLTSLRMGALPYA